MLNEIILVCRMIDTPSLRKLSSGATIATGRVANTRVYYTNNEKREQTLFIDAVFFGRQAEVASEYLTKGRLISIIGRLEQVTWKNQRGETRTSYRIAVRDFEFLDSNDKKKEEKNGECYLPF